MMMRSLMAALLLVPGALSAAPVPAAAPPTLAPEVRQRLEWNQPLAPFRIIGNVWYVGTRGLSAFLVTGPQGHVLIDGALPESAPLIAANIQALGFRLADVRYLLVNHTHFDHAGGLAELQRLTGATLVASAAEKADLDAGKTIGRDDLAGFPIARVDRIVGDGDVVRVGPLVLTAIASPGHTRGGVSWMTKADGGRTVLFATSLTVAGQNLVDDPVYPVAAADFRRTLARLRTVPADVFVNFHPGFFGMDAKLARQQRGDADAFVNPGETRRQIDQSRAQFDRELARQRAAKTPR